MVFASGREGWVPFTYGLLVSEEESVVLRVCVRDVNKEGSVDVADPKDPSWATAGRRGWAREGEWGLAEGCEGGTKHSVGQSSGETLWPLLSKWYGLVYLLGRFRWLHVVR